MQTLGLSGETKRSDGRLKSIFWPTVENAWDVDYLGQQGFWICAFIAVFQLAVALISGNIILAVSGIVTAIVFFIGGMGVREASWPAAAMVFAIYLTGILFSLASGQPPNVLTIIAAAVLLSNVRAAFLASEWRPLQEGEDRPTRFSETISDKLVDQLPQKAWPVLKVFFFSLASLLLLLGVLGLAGALLLRSGLIHGLNPAHN